MDVVQFALARIDWRRSPVLVLTARSSLTESEGRVVRARERGIGSEG